MSEVSALEVVADPLLEREAAPRAMAQALAAARAGNGAAVFVTGAPGIGKTSVMEAGASAGARDGFRVAEAVGAPM